MNHFYISCIFLEVWILRLVNFVMVCKSLFICLEMCTEISATLSCEVMPCCQGVYNFFADLNLQIFRPNCQGMKQRRKMKKNWFRNQQ